MVGEWRFRWLWPLVLVHAWGDFTTILAARPLPDAVVAVDHIALLVFGLGVVLWPRPARHGVTDARSERLPTRGSPGR